MGGQSRGLKWDIMERQVTARRLLVATHNPGKIREYRAILRDLPLELTWLDAEGIHADVPETGETCEENARIKAQAYAEISGLWTWADDTGLWIDALDGRPGVHAARYAGAGATDAERQRKVLGELAAFPRESWSAHFECVVALVDPARPFDGIDLLHGRLDGRITDKARGEFGFGYDPIFFLPEFGRTLAELDPEVKNRISHRAMAAERARARIEERLKPG